MIQTYCDWSADGPPVWWWICVQHQRSFRTLPEALFHLDVESHGG